MLMIMGTWFALPNLLDRDVMFSILVVLGSSVLYWVIWQVLRMWLRTCRTRRIFEAQGVKCLPRPFVHGNLPEFVAIGAKARSHPMPKISHNIAPRILPHLYQWSNTYGERFAYWYGFQARFILTEPEQAKDLLMNKSGHFKKPTGRPDTIDLAGMGLVSLDGEKWAHHRRILNPAFFVEKLKAMAPIMVACTEAIMKSWELRVEREEEIDVSEEFRTVTGDIIAHTAFGSSFAEGKQVFELQHEQQILFQKLNASLYIPGSRFLPTAQNRYRKKLNSTIKDVLGKVITKRMESCEIACGDMYGNDLLG
eukprot:c27084_g1_i1 orf=194-1120(+)